ncbi:MAG: hypothetical protein ACFE96_07185 [Candidatus Hermodarchaeota archaeon]
MNKKIKYGIIAFIPSCTIFFALIILLLFSISILIILLMYTIIVFPYCIAIYLEYSKRGDKKIENLSDYELNLIQEKDHIIKALEIIIISFSLLFGLFTAIEFDLQIAEVPNSINLRLIGAPFGVDFFMATFVFIQVQVFGKDSYLTEAELESLTINSKKTDKIKNLLKRLHLANFTRRGCYYSLLIQICMIYPVVMFSVSI